MRKIQAICRFFRERLFLSGILGSKLTETEEFQKYHADADISRSAPNMPYVFCTSYQIGLT